MLFPLALSLSGGCGRQNLMLPFFLVTRGTSSRPRNADRRAHCVWAGLPLDSDWVGACTTPGAGRGVGGRAVASCGSWHAGVWPVGHELAPFGLAGGSLGEHLGCTFSRFVYATRSPGTRVCAIFSECRAVAERNGGTGSGGVRVPWPALLVSQARAGPRTRMPPAQRPRCTG